ncbi:MAG: GerAB/ArcD/ProY family transporter [Ignavibacteriales bacterium]
MNDQISIRQVWLLISTSIISVALIFQPAYIVRAAGKDAWLAVAITAAIAIPTAVLVVLPGLRFPGQSFAQYAESILGTIPGKLISLVYVIIFTILLADVLRQFGDLFTVGIMPYTPISIFIGILLLVSSFTVHAGIKVLARAAEIIGPLVFLFIYLVLIFSLPHADVSNISPILEQGWGPVLSGVSAQMPFMPQIIITAFLLDKVKNPQSVIKAALGYVLLVGFTLTIICLFITMVFSEEYANMLFVPLLTLSRLIEIPGSLAKVDPGIVALWILGGFLKISVLHYIIVTTLKDIIGMRDYRPLILPTGLIAASLSLLMFSNFIEIENFTLKAMSIYHSVFFIGIPALMLLVAVLRHKGESTVTVLRETWHSVRTDVADFFNKLKQLFSDIVLSFESEP